MQKRKDSEFGLNSKPCRIMHFGGLHCDNILIMFRGFCLGGNFEVNIGSAGRVAISF
jgi:hypothetical protein